MEGAQGQPTQVQEGSQPEQTQAIAQKQNTFKRSLSDNFDNDQEAKDAREQALLDKLTLQFGFGGGPEQPAKGDSGKAN